MLDFNLSPSLVRFWYANGAESCCPVKFQAYASKTMATEPTEAMRWGSAFDMYVCEHFDPQFLSYPEILDKFKLKASSEYANRVKLQAEKCVKILKENFKQIEVQRYIKKKVRGMMLSGQIDVIADGMVIDLKLSEQSFERAENFLGYDLEFNQRVHYYILTRCPKFAYMTFGKGAGMAFGWHCFDVPDSDLVETYLEMLERIWLWAERVKLLTRPSVKNCTGCGLVSCTERNEYKLEL